MVGEWSCKLKKRQILKLHLLYFLDNTRIDLNDINENNLSYKIAVVPKCIFFIL